MNIDLKAIVAEMRSLGITRLKTPEYELDLGAPPPPEPQPKPQDKEVNEVERDEREWNRFWERANRSSGTANPPFPRRRPQADSK